MSARSLGNLPRTASPKIVAFLAVDPKLSFSRFGLPERIEA